MNWKNTFQMPVALILTSTGLLGCSGGGSSVGANYLVIAGDIAQCTVPATDPTLAARKTSELVKGLLVKHGDKAQVLTLGDNVYNVGSAAEFQSCYAPTWGQFLSRTWGIPGNHDYGTSGASGFFDYFGANSAGANGENARLGYYKRHWGDWTIFALNSNVSATQGSAQFIWLDNELKASSGCRLAVWHHPMFTSAARGNNLAMAPVWPLLETSNVDLVFQGHEHQYERFAAKSANGGLASTGVRSFVVGTGGAQLSGFATPQLGSEVRISAHGVLVLKLEGKNYSWDFINVDGSVLDSGSGVCKT